MSEILHTPADMPSDMDIGDLTLANFINVPEVQCLMDYFFSLTHIGVGIIDLEGTILVATGWQEICTRFHRVHPDTCQNCIESDTMLSQGVTPGNFRLYRCKNNMWDIATPIMVGGVHMGNLFLGQFLFDDEEPDYSFYRSQAQRYGFDEEAYIEAVNKVPRWSRETVNSAMHFYTRFVHMLSDVSHINIRLARSVRERDGLLQSVRENEEHLKIAVMKFQTLFDSFPLGISITDADGRIVEVNAESERLLGISRSEHEGRGLESPSWVFIRSDGTPMPTGEYAGVRAMKEHQPVRGVEMGVRQPDGSTTWLNVSAAPLELEKFGVVMSYEDITAQKDLEAALRKTIANRDVLLSEVHHRVKNNLTSIIALISLQQHASPFQSADAILDGLKGRVRSMALVHDMLCRSDTLEWIEYDRYLEALLPHLISPSVNGSPIELTMLADGIRLTLDTAIPCSLIVHELVTNSVKYAFPQGTAGDGISPCEIRVEILREGTDFILTVQDNGIGLPISAESYATHSLGFRLVRMMAEHQMGGTVRHCTGPDGYGAVSIIRFSSTSGVEETP